MVKKEFDLDKYVEEAKRLKSVYFYSGEREVKAGYHTEVEPDKVYVYQFEWLRILKPYIDGYEDEPFHSIEEMIEHVNEDGSCMKDYLIEHGNFPMYESF